jgi:hypothetical protein
MLHPVKPPLGVVYLKSLVRIQFKVLSLACSKNGLNLLNDQTSLVKKFGQRWGDWLHERINSSQPFRESIVNLITAIDWHNNRIRAGEYRKHILHAFINDVHYNEKILTPDGFSFSYSKLNQLVDNNTLKALRSLMEKFYDYILESGIPKGDIKGSKYKREDFVRDFWNVNKALNVCPACDNKKPPSTDGKVRSENDHFLPKSIYPFLSIHPSNLLPVCKYCNQSYKGGKDPIDDKYKDPIDDNDNAPLSRSFFPYELPAFNKIDGSDNERIAVEVAMNTLNERQVSLSANDTSDTNRVANIIRLLELDAQWKDEIVGIINLILETLRKESQRDSTYLSKIKDDSMFCRELEIERRSYKKRIGEELHSILKTSYLSFALNNLEERTYLKVELAKDTTR